MYAGNPSRASKALSHSACFGLNGVSSTTVCPRKAPARRDWRELPLSSARAASRALVKYGVGVGRNKGAALIAPPPAGSEPASVSNSRLRQEGHCPKSAARLHHRPSDQVERGCTRFRRRDVGRLASDDPHMPGSGGFSLPYFISTPLGCSPWIRIGARGRLARRTRHAAF